MTAKIELLQREIVALSHAIRRIKSGGIILMTDNIAIDMLNRFVELRDKLIAEEKAKQIPGKKPEDFSFGLALALLKNGHRVARRGWNGKGMFVVFQKGYPDGIPCNKQTAEAWGLSEGEEFRCEPYLQIKMANGSHAMWVPSINDVLAEDWVMV